MTEVSATFKFGGGYDSPWLVFRADGIDQLQDELARTFAIDPEATLPEQIVDAHSQISALVNASAHLGAKPIRQGYAKTQPANGAPVQKVPVQAPESPVDALKEAIDTCATVEELKALYVAHKALFANEDVKAAWSARGKALKG